MSKSIVQIATYNLTSSRYWAILLQEKFPPIRGIYFSSSLTKKLLKIISAAAGCSWTILSLEFPVLRPVGNLLLHPIPPKGWERKQWQNGPRARETKMTDLMLTVSTQRDLMSEFVHGEIRVETKKEAKVRNENNKAKDPVDMSKKVCILHFLGDLNGLQVASAAVENCLDHNGRDFCKFKAHLAEDSSMPGEDQAKIADGLFNLANDLWQVKIFLNPFYQDGVEVPGRQVWAIALSGRQTPELKKKDEEGEGLYRPQNPTHYLRINTDGEPVLVPA